MLTIKTAYKANKNGTGVIVAKANGKQRTTNYDHGKSVRANHGTSAGTLANVLLDNRQQAMVRHPSGGQRVTVATFDNGTGVTNIDV